jgi:hypothetical protein
MSRPDSLSVPEMLRIMDVATTLRQDRELVEEQLNVDALKERLKERMLAASKVTGESVTPEEVDAAISQYYASLYTFREPKLSFPVFLAHLWVRRRAVVGSTAAALAAIYLGWWLFLSADSPMTAAGRRHRRVELLATQFDYREKAVRSGPFGKLIPAELDRLVAEAQVYRTKGDTKGLESARKALDDLEAGAREAERLKPEISKRAETIRALAVDKKVAPEVDRLLAEAEVSGKKEDAKGLASVDDTLAGIESRLREEYNVTVVAQNTVAGANKNAIVRHINEKGRPISGYYLFVQARRPDGSVIPRRVHNDETDKYKEVTTWAERVPEAVYERLKKDKLEDGILNETAFAVKRKGHSDEEITMPGADGKPFARMGQITEW